MSQTLTGIVRVSIGQGEVNVHTGTFDNNYWGATPTSGELFVCGTGPTDNVPYHYWIGFTNYPTINSTPTGAWFASPARMALRALLTPSSITRI